MPDCITNTLIINIQGKGSISPPAGDYCNDTIIVLTPAPANGYFFKEWKYTGTGISEGADLLSVPMSINREITAIFEQIPGYGLSDYLLFYCPSETNKTNTIDFDYTNLVGVVGNPNRFHFRATFYTNVTKTNILYTIFSLSDNKRWFYNDGSYKQIPTEGVQINVNTSMTITYEPEILSQELMESQKVETINETHDEEFSLICGNSYYVDIERYSIDNESLDFIKSISMITDCEDVDAFYRSYDNDKNNWICSSNGNSDLKVSGSISQSLFPDIASNNFGIFQIVWQSRRSNVIYGSQWDSENDLLYSSGQGMYDNRFLKDGYNLMILKDLANNFYISANTRDSIYYNSYRLLVEDIEKPIETTDQTFEKLCYPGQTNFLTSIIEDIKIRVYEEDTDDSVIVNKDKIIPVINKQSIRFDIDGVNGLYAVRIRDSNDSQWSDWINIDVVLPLEEGEDAILDAYKIGDSRIIVPWNLDRINGVRRICFQLLTLYGISPSICIDVFMNMDIIEHIFEFYKDSIFTEFVPIYNGFQLLSQVRDEDGNIIGNNEDGTTTIYFKVIFSENILTTKNNINYYGNNQYSEGDFTFNVVQQGINDIWGEILERIDNKIFKGEFKIYENDGVFDKDGKSFIQLIFSDSIEVSNSISDISDPYNLMVNDTDANRFKDLETEEAFKQHKKSQILKTLDINSFKQYYDQDDINFRFGNPIIFRNDKQGEIDG